MSKRLLSLMLSTAVAASAMPAVLANPVDELKPEGELVAENPIADREITYGDTITDIVGAVSSDTQVIKVEEDGTLRAVGIGTAVISVNIGEEETIEEVDRLSIKVLPRTVEYGTVGVFSKVYDGEKGAAISTPAIAVNNAVEGDEVYVTTKDASAEFETAQTGEELTVSVSGLALSGADSDKYVLESDTVEVKSSIVDEMNAQLLADGIVSLYQPKGEKKLVLPDILEGYDISVKSTSDAKVVAEDMSVMAHAVDKEVTLVLTVTKTVEEEIPEPEESPEPEVTPEPEETPEPEVTPEAQDSSEPEESDSNENDEEQTEQQSADTIELKFTVFGVDTAEITVNAENGTVEGAGIYPMGESVTLKATAAEGYIFAGWSVCGELLSYDSEYTFTAERVMTVDAAFIEEGSRKVTVTVENDSKVTGAGEYNFGDTVSLSTSGSLAYWSVNGKVISQSNPYVFTAVEDVTVKAHYKNSGSLNNNYTYQTITFVSNGGTKVADLKVPRNTVAAAPAAPTRTGYEFTGWYTDEELKTRYTFKDRVLEDITLYAGWKKTAATDEEVLPFKDVKKSDWYYSAVEFVYNNDIMKGMTDNTFEPNTTLTRAMFVTVLHRAEGTPKPGAKAGFADVEDGAWYADSVEWAAENGIVAGYDDDTFAPHDTITREQMAAMLYRYASYRGYDMTGSADISGFNDSDKVSDWALAAVKWAVDTEIISGMTDTELAPQGTATRAQCASILMRCIENLKIMNIEE